MSPATMTSGQITFEYFRGKCEIVYHPPDLFFASKEIYVYLIHLDDPICHARHYIGSTDNPSRRLREHARKRKSGGSPLLKAANQQGIAWRISRIWKASRDFERYLKQQKNAKRFCPLCQGEPF